MTIDSVKKPTWLTFNVAALTASLAHIFIDAHLRLFGSTSSIMSPLQAASILSSCLVVAWWSVSLATAQTGRRAGLSGALALAIGWAFLGNGMVFVFAPPPSAAFPYQDIAHFSSLIFGALAAYTTWREIRQNRITVDWHFVGIAVGLILSTPQSEKAWKSDQRRSSSELLKN